MIAPTLIFSWGNPSRGDDAIGPCITDKLVEQQHQKIDVLTDFQLQIEHTLDLQGRDRVLFVDASMSAATPFEFFQLSATPDDSYTSHAMSPQSLLSVYGKLNQGPAPPSFMLSVAADHFELGAPISTPARASLDSAMRFIETELIPANTSQWNRLAKLPHTHQHKTTI